MKGGISLTANYDSSDKSLVVKVKDTGVGIKAKDRQLLFSQFGRLHRTAEFNKDGIGLGLTIVKQIVEASGGIVSVHSDGAGQGSSFVFNMKMETLDATKDGESVPTFNLNPDSMKVQQPDDQSKLLLGQKSSQDQHAMPKNEQKMQQQS